MRDIDRLAWVVRESWKENQLIHPSTTNAEIGEMLRAPGVAENYQAMKLLGAGGGIRRVPQRRPRSLSDFAKRRG